MPSIAHDKMYTTLQEYRSDNAKRVRYKLRADEPQGLGLAHPKGSRSMDQPHNRLDKDTSR